MKVAKIHEGTPNGLRNPLPLGVLNRVNGDIKHFTLFNENQKKFYSKSSCKSRVTICLHIVGVCRN